MNPYEILGISKDSTAAEVKAAYRKKSRKFHPDSQTGSKEEMQKINEAYKMITKDKANNNDELIIFDRLKKKEIALLKELELLNLLNNKIQGEIFANTANGINAYNTKIGNYRFILHDIISKLKKSIDSDINIRTTKNNSGLKSLLASKKTTENNILLSDESKTLHNYCDIINAYLGDMAYNSENLISQEEYNTVISFFLKDEKYCDYINKLVELYESNKAELIKYKTTKDLVSKESKVLLDRQKDNEELISKKRKQIDDIRKELIKYSSKGFETYYSGFKM